MEGGPRPFLAFAQSIALSRGLIIPVLSETHLFVLHVQVADNSVGTSQQNTHPASTFFQIRRSLRLPTPGPKPAQQGAGA